MSGTVRLVVGGVAHQAAIPAPDSRVRAMVEKALIENGHTGQQPVEWELRTMDGSLIDTGIMVRDAKILDGMTLYLNPRAGVGGALHFQVHLAPSVERGVIREFVAAALVPALSAASRRA